MEFVTPPKQWSRKKPVGFQIKPYRQSERVTRIRQFGDELRENPGKWAEYPGDLFSSRSAYSTAANVKGGKSKAFEPAGSFDAMARTIDGETKVFVSFKGASE